MSTVRPEEVERFNRLAAAWWDRTGPMGPLHVVNELRLGHVLEQIARRSGRRVGALQGLRILDVGCGAGLMCEPLAGRGATVVGIDAAANNIAAARLHAASGGLGAAAGHAPLAYLPAVHRAWWTRDLSVNYIASFGKPSAWIETFLSPCWDTCCGSHSRPCRCAATPSKSPTTRSSASSTTTWSCASTRPMSWPRST